MTHLEIVPRSRKLRSAFRISRGSKDSAHTIMAVLRRGEGTGRGERTGRGESTGRGECVPYARYGESLESVTGQIEAMRAEIEAGLDRQGLNARMPAGAARNALDCAFWDLEAKEAGKPAHMLAGLAPPKRLLTAYTLSVDTPEAMAKAAHAVRERPLLKLKAAGEGDLQRVAAVREAAPDAQLIVDANEAWPPDAVAGWLSALAEMGVTMVEQPLPAGQDGILAEIESPITLCADESFHDRESLDTVAGLYSMVNIKLDKTGGLTEALAAVRAARARDLQVMVGCMVAGSLAMAPAVLAAQGAEIVDLDGPLLLAEDETDALSYNGSWVDPPGAPLWG